MKNLYQASAEFLAIEEEKAPKGTRKPLTAKAIPNDPKDPFVLIPGFGKVRESQAKKLGYHYTKISEVYTTEEQLEEATHRFAVTLSDPNHTAVSKRTEQFGKNVSYKDTRGSSVTDIKDKVVDHYRKQGYKVHDVDYIGLKEAVETKLQLTMPLFIRLLEWAREECKSDVEIHQVAEKIAAVNGIADMDNYEELLK